MEVIVKTEKVYTIHLSEDEAIILAKIIGNINGSNHWRRKVVTPLYRSLTDKIGVMYEPTSECPEIAEQMRLREIGD